MLNWLVGMTGNGGSAWASPASANTNKHAHNTGQLIDRVRSRWMPRLRMALILMGILAIRTRSKFRCTLIPDSPLFANSGLSHWLMAAIIHKRPVLSMLPGAPDDAMMDEPHAGAAHPEGWRYRIHGVGALRLQLQLLLVALLGFRLRRFLEGLIHSGSTGGALDAFAGHQLLHRPQLETRVLLLIRLVDVEADAGGFC